MRVRQQDIARLAKVSQATVSRVLAGDAKVDAKISARVRAVMNQHNYQPDVRARSLRSRKTGLIGLVIKRPHGGLVNDPFFANLAGEILDYLDGLPFHLCLDIASDEKTQGSIYDEMLRTRRVDGLILVESMARDERIKRLQADAFPFVLIGNPQEEDAVWSVDNDNVLAGEMAAQHLVEQGFERIGMIAGPVGVTVSEDRISGYRRAMKQAGRNALIWNSDFGSEAARDASLAALQSEASPDALIVLDDFMAMGTVRAAREIGKKIPQDLALVSFNDSNLCELLECGLTSVSLNIREMVHTACAQLLAAIDEEEEQTPKRRIVPCELKQRGSSRGQK
ncbi:MAG: hypothetical protein BGO01_08020 [Armatimonadetes bacterium 55-13]|nr:LacI family DNA-binding transcriptional regulator [Armatimonadota bacterium]OJU62421.1 MAG: hypothetical protein BGO01_08020 [Armatimonadetes bacterium 55-13]